MSQLHILIEHAKGDFVEAVWLIAHAAMQRGSRDLRPRRRLLVQRSGEVNGQSFVNPMQLEHSQSLISLYSGATMPDDVSYDSLKWQSIKRNIHPGSTSDEDSRLFDPIIMNKYEGAPVHDQQ